MIIAGCLNTKILLCTSSSSIERAVNLQDWAPPQKCLGNSIMKEFEFEISF
jgi:hypothetical protein